MQFEIKNKIVKNHQTFNAENEITSNRKTIRNLVKEFLRGRKFQINNKMDSLILGRLNNYNPNKLTNYVTLFFHYTLVLIFTT